MTETVRKRRRWPWMALAVVLLLVGGPIAWRFRPLNANELRLIGPWHEYLGHQQFRLTSDRRFTIQERVASNNGDIIILTRSGSWSCRGDRLDMQLDESWKELGRRMLGRHPFEYLYSGEITWQSKDEFKLLVTTRSPRVNWERGYVDWLRGSDRIE